MVYKDLRFPDTKNPYFYSNFVATIDGKVQILTDTDAYWPLGSKLDYQTLIELRTYADVLIHGSTTALGHPTLVSLSKDEFQVARSRTGHKDLILYVVISNHPSDKLVPKVTSQHPGVKTMIITAENARISDSLEKATEIVRLGENTVDLSLLPQFFAERNRKHILVEGGPTLMGSFFEAGLIDEIFLTIAPKVVGNKSDQTLTMAEGFLFPPEKVPSFCLLSHAAYDDELYLRYRKRTND